VTANSTTLPPARKKAILQKARAHKQKGGVPLIAHVTMRWARKIGGTLFYYGKIDPDAKDFGAAAAVEEYHRVAGDERWRVFHPPTVVPTGSTMRETGLQA